MVLSILRAGGGGGGGTSLSRVKGKKIVHMLLMGKNNMSLSILKGKKQLVHTLLI